MVEYQILSEKWDENPYGPLYIGYSIEGLKVWEEFTLNAYIEHNGKLPPRFLVGGEDGKLGWMRKTSFKEWLEKAKDVLTEDQVKLLKERYVIFF